MSLEHAVSNNTEHSSRLAGMNEMQREDFLALAAALRQFNAYEPHVSMAIAGATSGAERYASVGE